MTAAAAQAYVWTRKQPEPLPQLEEPEPSQESGLDEAVDEAVKGVLDATGVLDKLELVTGMPTQLSAAAEEWHTQAKALQTLADALRMGAATLPEHWEGGASERFGHGMGDVVAAIDGTAQDMGRAAYILSCPAKECKLAEDTVVGLIRELIEFLAVEVVAMVALDVITLGIGTIVDALVADATVEAYIVRIERVVQKLGTALRDLMTEIRELRKAEGAWKKSKVALKGFRKAQAVTSAGGLMGPGSEGGSFLARQAAWGMQHEAETQFKKHVVEPIMGVEADPAGPVKDALTSDTAQQSLDRDIHPPEAHPYHVNQHSIEEDFG